MESTLTKSNIRLYFRRWGLPTAAMVATHLQQIMYRVDEVAVKRTQIQVSERFLVYRSVEYIAKHSSVRAVKKLDTKRDTSKGLREPRGWNSIVR